MNISERANHEHAGTPARAARHVLSRVVPRVVVGVATGTVVLLAAVSFAAPVDAAPAARSAPQHATTRTCSAGAYQVVPGDSWIGIAKKAGVSTRKLLAANAATARTTIHPGRSICLPAGAAAVAPVATPVSKQPATTKPPAATPSVVAVVARSYSGAEVEAIIRQVWPDELEDEALRIAIRESNLKPNAKNWCCSGLFQLYFNVHQSWLASIGVTSATQLLDPTVNTNAAMALYLRAGGWGPWQ